MRGKRATLVRGAAKTLLDQNLDVVGDFLLHPSPHTVILEKETLRLGSQPVGGRLESFAHNWQNDFYHRSLREGWRFRWVEDPPDMDMGEEVPDEEEDRKDLFKINQELLKKGAPQWK